MFAIGPIFTFLKEIFPYIICGVLIFLFMSWRHSEEERQRLEDNKLSNVEYLSKSEMKDILDSLNKTDIKDKNIKEFTSVKTETKFYIKTTIKDSTRFDSIKLRCINYQDKYTLIKGCFEDSILVRHTDKLSIILYKKPTKKFLFIKYAKKDTIEIFNEDPHSKYKIKSIRRDK